jgi:hypothetical protein
LPGCNGFESAGVIGLQRFVSSGMASASRAVAAWQLRDPPIAQVGSAAAGATAIALLASSQPALLSVRQLCDPTSLLSLVLCLTALTSQCRPTAALPTS